MKHMKRDLFVLTADKDQQQTMLGLLNRSSSLGIRKLSFDVESHPQHDAGIVQTGVELARLKQRTHAFVLLVLDLEGCGWESTPTDKIEAELEARLVATGWNADTAKCLVIAPEVEQWVWSDSPEVDAALGWDGESLGSLRHWLVGKAFEFSPDGKPKRPKEAMRAALREKRVQISSAIFSELASRVSLRRCKDRTFLKLCAILRQWFAEPKTECH
ncbi:MAG: methylation-associated defense system protein MAD4 [Prosthecobacter sp.]|uniref:methylation-associated defense system protein MAD4 n=1 Tax=Prosthecobacter sp. TaxID=1965333 RepID=UPI0039016023